jgi:dTDP-4-amino-4,6-dideoxygalactose transaminase
MDKPAVLGGAPLFANRLGIVSPKLPPLEKIGEQVQDILRTGNLTNNSRYVREFEQALAERLSMPHVVTVSNATLGLILALNSLQLEGDVILPSFTYCATAHVLHWARLKPVFADILPDSFTLDPAAVEAAITPRTAAIMPVHIYGHPCEIDELAAVARRHGLPLLYDSAHAFGSLYRGQPVGQFGEAEIFSFHATKVFPVGEGGCITTHRVELAEYLTLARKFGDPGNENTRFPGLNAKMQEFNAIIGLEMLKVVDQHIANRRSYAAYLIDRLGQLPGITFQTIRPYVFTNYQNFGILVDEAEFGLSRDQLFTALAAENILARKYFYPPIHHQDAYSEYRSTSLPVTERVARQVLCLPFYSEMTQAMLDGICTAMERIHHYAPRIRHELGQHQAGEKLE